MRFVPNLDKQDLPTLDAIYLDFALLPALKIKLR